MERHHPAVPAARSPLATSAAGSGRSGRRAVGSLRRSSPRISNASATSVADALEMRGLVERRADPTDRRATLIALTPRGEEVTTGVLAARGAEGGGILGLGRGGPDRRRDLLAQARVRP